MRPTRVLIAYNPKESAEAAALLKKSFERLSEVKVTDLKDIGARSGTIAREVGAECSQCGAVVVIVGRSYGPVDERLGLPLYHWACESAEALGIPVLVYLRACDASECDENVQKWRNVLRATHSPLEFMHHTELMVAAVADLHNQFGNNGAGATESFPGPPLAAATEEENSEPKEAKELRGWVGYLVPRPLRPYVQKISAPWAFILGIVVWKALEAGFSSPLAAWVGTEAQHGLVYATLRAPDHATKSPTDDFDESSLAADTMWDAPKTWGLGTPPHLQVAGEGIGFLKSPNWWEAYFDYTVHFQIEITDPKQEKGASWILRHRRYRGKEQYYKFNLTYPTQGTGAALVAWRYGSGTSLEKIGTQPKIDYQPFAATGVLQVDVKATGSQFEHTFIYYRCVPENCEDENNDGSQQSALITDANPAHAIPSGSPGFTTLGDQPEQVMQFKLTILGETAPAVPTTNKESGKEK